MNVLSFIDKYLSPQFARFAGIVAIVYLGLLGLVRLLEIWRSFHTRRALLEEEKIFHEILKIRYEIEVFRRQHSLEDLSLTAAQDPARRAVIQGEPLLTIAGLRQYLKLPELPSSSLFHLFAWKSLSVERPPIGPKRAVWALKWLGAVFIVYFMLLALAAGFGSWETPVVQSLSNVLAIAVLYLLLVALYNGFLALVATSAKLYHELLKKHV